MGEEMRINHLYQAFREMVSPGLAWHFDKAKLQKLTT